jgi:PST family polysaccharide transporter
MSNDLRLAAKGIGWNYLGSGTTLVAQVLSTAITARLVSPAGFGAYAAAQALAAAVGYFGLSTLGNAVIRHERQGRQVASTAFTLSIAAGAVTAAAIFLIAPAWASLWHVPASANLARLFALVLFLAAFGVVPLALLRKSLAYRQAALIESLSQVAGMAVGVALAFDLHSPTALVIGQAAASALTAGAALIASRRELSIGISRTEARSLLAFTGHVSGQSLLYYALYTAPSLTVSRIFGPVALGWYSRANLMVTLPVTHLWLGVTKALYPLIARARGDVARLRELIESTLLTTTALAWPAFAAVAGASSLVVRVLLGPHWSQVAAVLPPLLVFGAVNLAYVVAGNPLEVLGRQRIMWSIQLLWVGLLAPALALGAFAHLSLPALLWLVAGVQAIVHAAKLWRTSQLGILRLGRVLRAYAFALALSALFFLAAAGVERATASSGSLTLRILAEVVAITALAAVTVTLLPSTRASLAIRAGISLVRAGRKLTAPPDLTPAHAKR